MTRAWILVGASLVAELGLAPSARAQLATVSPEPQISSELTSSETGSSETAPSELGSSELPTDGSPPAPAIDDLRLGREDGGLGNGVWVSAGVFGGDVRDDSVLMGTTDLGVRFALAPDARVSLDWGFAVAETRVRGAYTSPTTVEPFAARVTRVEARNADLRFEWLPFIAPLNARVGFGIGVSIPVAATTRLPSSAETQAVQDASSLVHEAYLAANGGFQAWRYRPERVAVYLPVTFALALAPETVLSIEGAGAIGVRVLGNLGPELLGDLVLAADLGTALIPELRLGARVSVAGLDLGTATSAAQPAAGLWGRVELAPVSILLRGDVGLGGPYGVGSSFAGWGLHLGASVAL